MLTFFVGGAISFALFAIGMAAWARTIPSAAGAGAMGSMVILTGFVAFQIFLIFACLAIGFMIGATL